MAEIFRYDGKTSRRIIEINEGGEEYITVNPNDIFFLNPAAGISTRDTNADVNQRRQQEHDQDLRDGTKLIKGKQ